jgi:hypothetical protein
MPLGGESAVGGASRARRRRWSKRRLHRSALKDVERIVVLADRGISTAAIASSISLPQELVEEVLRSAHKAREGEGGGNRK